MFWNLVAPFYGLFEKFYNRKVNQLLCLEIEQLTDNRDNVLECACGTGMLSRCIARKAASLVATDFADGMLRQARKKCASLDNVVIERADITALPYMSERFDKVVAGNVIHLLDHPEIALKELLRVCKPGGKVIIPTYINNENIGQPSIFVELLSKCGAQFKRQFDYQTYKQFFVDKGYPDAEFSIVRGKMPCAVAVIIKPSKKDKRL